MMKFLRLKKQLKKCCSVQECNFAGGGDGLRPRIDLHPKKVTHKKSTGAKKVTFLEEKNGKRKCTSRSKNQSNN